VARTADRKGSGGLGGLRDTGGDLVHLVIDYVKQETLTPLKGLGRYLGLGIAGAVCFSVGLVVLAVAFLRLLQGETSAFDGNLSWVPYLLLTVVVLAVAALAVWRITKGPARPATPDEERP
jgi:Putative Actinobacterial Holin-X, holin superfamily III